MCKEQDQEESQKESQEVRPRLEGKPMTIFKAVSKRASLLVPALVLAILAVGAATASAAGWEVTGRSFPTDLRSGGTGVVQLNLYSIGTGSPTGVVTVTDVLPEGLTFTGTIAESNGRPLAGSCSGTNVVTCQIPVERLPAAAGGPGGAGYNAY